MGKSKTTKFKRPQFNSVGLPVTVVKEGDGEEEAHGDDSCPAAELLEKVGIYNASSSNVSNFEFKSSYFCSF